VKVMTFSILPVAALADTLSRPILRQELRECSCGAERLDERSP